MLCKQKCDTALQSSAYHVSMDLLLLTWFLNRNENRIWAVLKRTVQLQQSQLYILICSVMWGQTRMWLLQTLQQTLVFTSHMAQWPYLCFQHIYTVITLDVKEAENCRCQQLHRNGQLECRVLYSTVTKWVMPDIINKSTRQEYLNWSVYLHSRRRLDLSHCRD